MASPLRFPTISIAPDPHETARAFALDGDPFAADAAFVPIPGHMAALETLRHWIDEMRRDSGLPNRLAVLTGEKGSGKSRLLGELASSIEDETLHLVRLPDVPSHRTDAQLLKAIIAGLDADPSGRTGLELRADVRSALGVLNERGMQTGLLIDDADFKGSQLELIRNLMRDAAGTGLWIVLTGTPDLHDRMQRRRSLRGLMTPAISLDNIPGADLAMLMTRRIDQVRTEYSPAEIIQQSTFAVLAEWAMGNPLRMMHATRTAMLAAATMGADTVSVEITEETVRQLTVNEANEVRAEVAATHRAVQAELVLPESDPAGSSRATTQRMLWNEDES